MTVGAVFDSTKLIFAKPQHERHAPKPSIHGDSHYLTAWSSNVLVQTSCHLQIPAIPLAPCKVLLEEMRLQGAGTYPHALD